MFAHVVRRGVVFVVKTRLPDVMDPKLNLLKRFGSVVLSVQTVSQQTFTHVILGILFFICTPKGIITG